ncbi:hypothetical protein GGI43DRAFT_409518 [Trichoderma evansii]
MIVRYIHIGNRMLDLNQPCTKLVRLHRESQSPMGQFGFYITTCQGRIPQSLTWKSNWTIFFAQILQHVINMDFKLHEYWEELVQVEKQLIAHVIPRLLLVREILIEKQRLLKKIGGTCRYKKKVA